MRIYQHFIFELFFQLNVESSQNCIVYLFTNHVTQILEKSLGILLLLLFSLQSSHFFFFTFFHFRCSFYLFDRWLCFQLCLGLYFFASYKALCSLYITCDTG